MNIYKNIVIIIPAYNEHENIYNLIKLIHKVSKHFRIFIIDDSEFYKTKNIIKNLNNKNLFYFNRKKKLGRGTAILYGIKKVLKLYPNTKCFIEMDADLSHNPNELKKKITIFNSKKADLLISGRYNKNSKIINWPMSRRVLSKLSNIIAKIVIQAPIKDYTNGYRAYSKKAVSLIIKKCGKSKNDFILLSEIVLVLFSNKLKIYEKETIFVNRIKGKSNVNIKLIVDSFFSIIKMFINKKLNIKKYCE